MSRRDDTLETIRLIGEHVIPKIDTDPIHRTTRLRDAAAGKPVTITGQFRIAQGTGRLPVVVLQHGSAGFGANIEVWSRELNELGISTFALDGFTGRGLTEVNSDQALLGQPATQRTEIDEVLALGVHLVRIDELAHQLELAGCWTLGVHVMEFYRS